MRGWEGEKRRLKVVRVFADCEWKYLDEFKNQT